MDPLFQHLIELKINRWNALVGRMRFIREEGNHMVFLHPTKGYRKISKKRLGVSE